MSDLPLHRAEALYRGRAQAFLAVSLFLPRRHHLLLGLSRSRRLDVHRCLLCTVVHQPRHALVTLAPLLHGHVKVAVRSVCTPLLPSLSCISFLLGRFQRRIHQGLRTRLLNSNVLSCLNLLFRLLLVVRATTSYYMIPVKFNLFSLHRILEALLPPLLHTVKDPLVLGVLQALVFLQDIFSSLLFPINLGSTLLLLVKHLLKCLGVDSLAQVVSPVKAQAMETKGFHVAKESGTDVAAGWGRGGGGASKEWGGQLAELLQGAAGGS